MLGGAPSSYQTVLSPFFLLALFAASCQAGQIKPVSNSSLCLTITTPSSASSALHLAPCLAASRAGNSQLWREHPSIYQIASAKGSKCLSISHVEDGSLGRPRDVDVETRRSDEVDPFSHDAILATSCKYTTRDAHASQTAWTQLATLLSGGVRFADGWQRLIFDDVSRRILWRGQAKVLPQDERDRY